MIEPTPVRGMRLGAAVRRFGIDASGRWIGAILLAVIVGLCFVVPVVWPDSSDALVAPPYQAPSLRHPFGTDSVGRDLFVRTFAGGRIDLIVATLVVGVSLMLGTLVGTLAGASKRRGVDSTLMRLVDALIAFPFVILILCWSC